MKMRNKGKVYPSPSLSSSSSTTSSSNPPSKDGLSVLKLLPAAIIASASAPALSLEDREVLAYMITRSLKSTTPSSIEEEKKKTNKKSTVHKPPVFDCGCFDCYTSFWFRWDSSPNRELIHQVIEAFEEHLNHGEQSRKGGNRGGKKREKMGRRFNEKAVDLPEVQSVVEEKALQVFDESSQEVVPESEVSKVIDSPEKADETLQTGEKEALEFSEISPEGDNAPPETAVVMRGTATNHKGLLRKVLPDVMGLFNSRLWSLWNPSA